MPLRTIAVVAADALNPQQSHCVFDWQFAHQHHPACVQRNNCSTRMIADKTVLEHDPDPLSNALQQLLLPPWMAAETICGADWRQQVPAGFASIYAVRTGRILLSTDGLGRLAFEAGDVFLLPHGLPHNLAVSSGSRSAAGSRLPFEARAVIVHGHLPLATLGLNPFRRILQQVNQLDSSIARPMDPLLQMISDEQTARQPGWQLAVGQIIQMVFVEALRSLFTHETPRVSSSGPQVGWLTAALDESIGPTLALMHNEPARPWTVNNLAQHAQMSRSSFTTRFRSLVGQPPLEYLTECRMQRACRLLKSTQLGMRKVAKLVGYDSASSFSTRFKRLIGVSPHTYRQTSLLEAPTAAGRTKVMCHSRGAGA